MMETTKQDDDDDDDVFPVNVYFSGCRALLLTTGNINFLFCKTCFLFLQNLFSFLAKLVFLLCESSFFLAKFVSCLQKKS